jgi:hypothetical protein
MSNYYHPDSDYYRKVLDAAPPVATGHGTEEDIRDKLKPMMPSKWRMQGNQLIAETENGTHVQTIPTSHILVGTNEKGLPIFKKVVV